MLQLLTKYLFQYKTVSVPHVGTFRLIHKPAQLDVVEKMLAPPSFVVELNADGDVPEHQLNFLGHSLHRGKVEVLDDLNFFGDKLQQKINGPGFEWEGLGTITRSTESLPLVVKAIQPVTAQKITRADAEHQILVGDKHRTSVQMSGRTTVLEAEERRSWYMLAGWILLILSILAIAFFLYTGKFNVNAAGSKQHPLGSTSSARSNFI
jgi:hypothetical protein